MTVSAIAESLNNFMTSCGGGYTALDYYSACSSINCAFAGQFDTIHFFRTGETVTNTVMSGVKAGDEVIVGPFNSVRDLKDGDAVKVQSAAAKK
jgi:hypothetical protein